MLAVTPWEGPSWFALVAAGHWTIDNYEALTGLATYGWLATQVGNQAQARWAAAQYASLLSATSKTLDATMSASHLSYLPCSMTAPNTDNRCGDPEDANWAAPFLFGAPQSGPGITAIDATYDYGFGRLAGALPASTFGGYPTQYYSTAYNAGYGEWGLASRAHRARLTAGVPFELPAFVGNIARSSAGTFDLASAWSRCRPAPGPGAG